MPVTVEARGELVRLARAAAAAELENARTGAAGARVRSAHHSWRGSSWIDAAHDSHVSTIAS